jgi:DNA modification methylase
LIGLLSKPGDVVLDPFVGSGTTLVEAQRLGRPSLGVDLNPVACLIARSKTLPMSALRVEALVAEIKEEVASALSPRLIGLSRRRVTQQLPPSVQLKWYTRRVLEDLGRLWSVVSACSGRKGLLATAAFSAVLLPVCRETRHWGYVCDNSTPKGDHEGNVETEVDKVLDRLVAAYRERDEELAEQPGPGRIARARVVRGDALAVLGRLPAKSVNVVVTSPPYFGVSDYVKAQRLSMEWLQREIEPLRLREIGARSKRHRQTAHADYVKELVGCFSGVRRVLKSGGACAIVVGESESRAAFITDLRQNLQGIGFKIVLDVNRTVSSQRRQAPSIKGEHVLVVA